MAIVNVIVDITTINALVATFFTGNYVLSELKLLIIKPENQANIVGKIIKPRGYVNTSSYIDYLRVIVL